MDADADENAVVDAGDACMLISVTRGHAGMFCWLGLLYFPLSAPDGVSAGLGGLRSWVGGGVIVKNSRFLVSGPRGCATRAFQQQIERPKVEESDFGENSSEAVPTGPTNTIREV